MKIIQAIVFLCITLLCGTAYSEGETSTPIQAELTQLISTLAKLTDMADACGEHMNYYGKKALEGAVCKEFGQAFYEIWPNRESLQQKVEDYTLRIELEEPTCDLCKIMLLRVEELRITVVYYLDYMDFIKES